MKDGPPSVEPFEEINCHKSGQMETKENQTETNQIQILRQVDSDEDAHRIETVQHPFNSFLLNYPWTEM